MSVSPLLHWLEVPPLAYWAVAASATIGLLTSAARPGPRKWVYPVLIFLVLLAWRWPYLLYPDELNTDESQYIAGALTLAHEPIFWRSVDGMSAGPLVYYALVPWVWLKIPLGYMVTRLTGLILIWLSLVICYKTLRRTVGDPVARRGILPGALFIASVMSSDLNHYSSELVSLPIIAAALACLIELASSSSPPSNRSWFWLGLLAGALPWAKLQSGPIGAVIVAGGWVLIMYGGRSGSSGKRLRPTIALIAGTLVTTTGFALLITAGGVWREFWQRYLLDNIHYAQGASVFHWYLNELHPADPAAISLWCYLGSYAVVIILGFSMKSLRSSSFVLSGAVCICALACVLYPQRDFLHYTMLLLVPLVTWGSFALNEIRIHRSPRLFRLAVVVFGLGVVGLFSARAIHAIPSAIREAEALKNRPSTQIDGLIGAFTRPGERLAVWGWIAQPYVTNQLRQGTRSAYSYFSIVSSPYRDRIRQVFLEDFRRNRPVAFIDTVGPNALFFQDRATEAHESFPKLAELIAADYVLVIDLDHARIYARRDVAQDRCITAVMVQSIIAKSRFSDWISRHLPVENLREQDGQHDLIDGRDVLMMRPPSSVEWTLRGDERELFFETGYAPPALKKPEGDGTGFELYLKSPNGTLRRFHTFLVNPKDNPTDRVPQSRRVPLPPYAKGSKLIIRTTPGPGENDAWDWAYITNVRFLRSPRFTSAQFPGFNRPPDRANSPLSMLVPGRDYPVLLLHAPSSLSYELTGTERHLSFAFGFLAGSYYGQHQTNGASFRVSARNPQGTVIPLRAVRLDPVPNLPDRDRHNMSLDLPVLPGGTQLVIEIDPDGNNAFDWTYIDDLWLD